jgi:hypothetical protein
VGELLGLQQGDCCGNSVFELVQDGPRVYAVCTMDEDDEVSVQFGGCGTRYLVMQRRAGEVAF